jgi:hypothetical protein
MTPPPVDGARILPQAYSQNLNRGRLMVSWRVRSGGSAALVAVLFAKGFSLG